MFLEKPSDGTRNGNGKVFLFCTVLVPPLRWSLIIINIIRRCVASTLRGALKRKGESTPAFTRVGDGV